MKKVKKYGYKRTAELANNRKQDVFVSGEREKSTETSYAKTDLGTAQTRVSVYVKE